MTPRDFINEIDREVSLTREWKDKLFNTIIPDGLGEILDYIKLNENILEKELSNEDSLKLPIDFGYPIDLLIGETKYDRVQLSHIANNENTYAILLNADEFRYNQPLITSNILSMSIYPKRNREKLGVRYEVRDTSNNVLAILYDNENVFYSQLDISDERQIKINLIQVDDIVRVRDGDTLKIKTNNSILNVVLKQNTPAIFEYFLAEDGTTYEEEALTTLITRPKPIKTPYILKFNSAVTGTMKLYYKISKPSFVNDTEDSRLIDDFHKALQYYCLKEIYGGTRKARQSAYFKNEYREALLLLSSKKGLQTENRIQRQIVPNADVYRNPVKR